MSPSERDGVAMTLFADGNEGQLTVRCQTCRLILSLNWSLIFGWIEADAQ